MPLTVTCTCGLVYSVPSSKAGSVVACRCGRSLTVPDRERTPPPATLHPDRASPHAADEEGTIQVIKRMVRTRELPASGPCPHSGKKADDVVVFRLRFDPVEERALAAAKAKPKGLFGWFGGKGAAALATPPDRPESRDVWVDMPLRVAHEAHAEILQSSGQKHFRDMLRTVPIYATLLAEHPTARIEPLPRHSDGQPTQGQRR